MGIPLIRIQNPKNESEKLISGFFKPKSTAPTTRYGGHTIRTILAKQIFHILPKHKIGRNCWIHSKLFIKFRAVIPVQP